jgi:hypothetical protein
VLALPMAVAVGGAGGAVWSFAVCACAPIPITEALTQSAQRIPDFILSSRSLKPSFYGRFERAEDYTFSGYLIKSRLYHQIDFESAL